MIQLLSSILFLAAAIIVIIVVATTERAEAQFGFVYDHDKRTLDFCTPYALHIGTVVRYLERADNGGIIENDTGTCASELGYLKWECENASTLNSPACSDPRYTNWLVNDYGAYPVGTWDFRLCTPGPGCTNINFPGSLGNGMIRP